MSRPVAGRSFRRRVLRLQGILKHGVDARLWRLPHARLYGRQVLRVLTGRRAPSVAPDPRDAAEKAAAWLARAQEATPDGGLAGRYWMESGWSSSYPETTGYAVPTLLRLASAVGEEQFRRRAGDCVEFLLDVQRPDGAFLGGEVADPTSYPSAFNTAQALRGLAAWHGESGDPRSLSGARRAADWLVEVQDERGTWRDYAYGGASATYVAHASCWLAEFGAGAGGARHRRAAGRHLDWVMDHYDPDRRWFARSGFPHHQEQGLTLTHNLGYVLEGVRRCALALDRSRAAQAVRESGRRLAESVLSWERVPGMLDEQGRPASVWACLTGNCQLAAFWLRLAESGSDGELRQAARLSLREVMAALPTGTGSLALDGGLPGSDPVWGGYLPNTFPNWAAKFFVDALLEWGID